MGKRLVLCQAPKHWPVAQTVMASRFGTTEAEHPNLGACSGERIDQAAGVYELAIMRRVRIRQCEP